MKAKIITMKELMEDNPTLCLSALRALEKCHKCEVFKRTWRYYGDIETALKKMKCKPKISKEVKELLRRKAELLDELYEIQKKLEEL